jgi:hypothetical protein
MNLGKIKLYRSNKSSKQTKWALENTIAGGRFRKF